MNFSDVNEINYNADGKYKELFHILMNKNLKYAYGAANVPDGALIANKLTVRSSLDESAFSALDAAVPDSGLFVCSECGKHLHEISPVCPECQKITGRRFF